VEDNELYEYWQLQRIEGENRVRRSWGFLGLKVTENYDNTCFAAEGRPKPQKDLKARDEEAKTDDEKAKREARIKKTIATMPHRLQTELELVIKDRDRTSCNPRFTREWSVVDIKPLKPKITTPATSWGAWWKGQGGNAEWECIIKGVTVETVDKNQSMKIPNRFSDPFRKPFPREVVRRRPSLEYFPRPRVEVMEPRIRTAPHIIEVQGGRREQGFVIPEIAAEEIEGRIVGLLAAVTARTEGAEMK